MAKNEILSPRINLLFNQLVNGDNDALDLFWHEIEANGSPIIEDIQDDDKYCLVTMIWKGREDIKKVAVFGEAFGFNTSENQLERLLDTDLWFRTYKARRDSRSFYIFFINEPDNDDVPFDELDTRIDPFNSNQYICITDENATLQKLDH